MFEKILETLSDTELVVIANEMNDPKVSNQSIIDQLISKSNLNTEYVGDLFKTKTLELTLAIDIMVELGKRLISRDSEL